MIWFGCITMTLMAVWMAVIAFDTNKNIKQGKADKEEEYKNQIEQKPVENKPKKIKIK